MVSTLNSLQSTGVHPLVIVFAKAPIPGRVKTRLQSALTANEAARLHEQFVAQTLEIVKGFPRVELHSDVETDAWPEFTGARRLQGAGDLGARLIQALGDKTAPVVMVVGSDAPTLPVEYLQELLASHRDVALGPAEDGGYYAIAARKTHPDMFANVRWSTEYALRDTVAACESAGLTVGLGRTWWDVDEPADLARLQRERVREGVNE